MERTAESVQYIWGIFSFEKWPHLWSKMKIVVIAFFDMEGPKGHNMNLIVYRIALQHLHHVVCQKCPHKWFLVPGFGTMCHSSQPQVCGSSWLWTTSHWLCICLNRFGPSNFFLFPRPKITLEWEKISSHHRATTPCNIAASGGSKTDLARALKSGRIAKSLHTFQRIILWRRKLWVDWKCFKFPTINSVTDIFDQLS